jgi:hypothetical protein
MLLKRESPILKLTAAALLTAIGIIIPMFSPLKIVMPPASFTLASHVAIFLAMFISPGVAAGVAVGTTLGFLLNPVFGPVIVLRAASHLVFVLVGSLYLKKYPQTLASTGKSQLFSLVIGIIHAVCEVVVVMPFYFGDGMAEGYYKEGFIKSVVLLVGVGTVVHSMVDFLFSLLILRLSSKSKEMRVVFGNVTAPPQDKKPKHFFKNTFSKKQIFIAAVLLLTSSVLYELAQLIIVSFGLKTYDVSIGIDKLLPFVPVFVIPYLLCFAYWFIQYCICARTRDSIQRFSSTLVLCAVVCFIFFLAFPTKIIRPEITGSDILSRLVTLTYLADKGAVNLFPSLHCCLSWLCFIEARRSGSRTNKFVTFIAAFVVFVSVLFVKQHYFVDIPSAILLTEFLYFLSGKKPIAGISQKFWTHIYKP